jgi:hypothetical protein
MLQLYRTLAPNETSISTGLTGREALQDGRRTRTIYDLALSPEERRRSRNGLGYRALSISPLARGVYFSRIRAEPHLVCGRGPHRVHVRSRETGDRTIYVADAECPHLDLRTARLNWLRLFRPLRRPPRKP